MAGECEICGESGAYYYILLEGARLHACEICARHGKVLSSEIPVQEKKVKTETKSAKIELVADFGRRIKDARERMKIERKVLAEMANEKESFIERIENEKTIPSEALAYKLQKVLGIKLFEQVKYEQVGEKKKSKGLTLGDVVIIKQK
jgi:putative transcription factor